MKPLNNFSRNILLLIVCTTLIALLLNYYLSPKIKYPVPGPVTSNYGMRKHPVTGEMKLHNGIDIGTPVGTEVTPNLPGTVLNTWWSDSGGKQMQLQFNNGYKMGLAHLSVYLKNKGDKFKANEVVALTGNTGLSTGPHLHLTMRTPNNKLIDPKKVLIA